MKILLVILGSLVLTSSWSQKILYKNGKYGLSDASGNVILKPKYDYIAEFVNGYAKMELKDKYGLIDPSGKEIVPPKYDYIADFVDRYARVQSNEKYGFIDLTGKEIVPTKYDHVRDFLDGIAGIELEENWGLVDTLGNVLVVPKYKYHIEFDFFTGFAQIAIYDPADKVWGNSLYGIMDSTFKEVVTPKYSFIKWIRFDYVQVSKGTKFGLLNPALQEIIPPKYENVAVLTEELIAISENEIWRFVNTSGKSVNEFGYTEVSYLSDDNLGRVSRNGKIGFIDATGKETIPCKFDEAESFSKGKAKVKLNGQEFSIDTKGNQIK